MTELATPLQTANQLPASSLNSSCITWRCALGHWLQSSAVHRVWHGVAKWSDSLPYLKSLLPCTNLPLYQHQSSTRPSHDLHHAGQVVSGLFQHLFTYWLGLRYGFLFVTLPRRPASWSRLFTVEVYTDVLRVPFKEAAS